MLLLLLLLYAISCSWPPVQDHIDAHFGISDQTDHLSTVTPHHSRPVSLWHLVRGNVLLHWNWKCTASGHSQGVHHRSSSHHQWSLVHSTGLQSSSSQHTLPFLPSTTSLSPAFEDHNGNQWKNAVQCDTGPGRFLFSRLYVSSCAYSSSIKAFIYTHFYIVLCECVFYTVLLAGF